MTAEPEYWYARSGDSALGRMNYTPVHWKGFVALFGIIFGCIGLLLAGALSTIFVLSGEIAIENEILKWSIAAIGASVATCSVLLAVSAFITLRKRVDPVNNASWHAKKFFGR